jgi:hypothetical protein
MMNSAWAIFAMWPSTAGSVLRRIRPIVGPSQQHHAGARRSLRRGHVHGGALANGASVAGTLVCLHTEHDGDMRKALGKWMEAGAHPSGLTTVRWWRRSRTADAIRGVFLQLKGG